MGWETGLPLSFSRRCSGSRLGDRCRRACFPTAACGEGDGGRGPAEGLRARPAGGDVFHVGDSGAAASCERSRGCAHRAAGESAVHQRREGASRPPSNARSRTSPRVRRPERGAGCVRAARARRLFRQPRLCRSKRSLLPRPVVAAGRLADRRSAQPDAGAGRRRRCAARLARVGSSAVRIAIVDTGIDGGHPNLGPRVISQAALDTNYSTIDYVGHGTAVAGVAVAIPDNGIGVAGIAYNASLMNVKASDDSTDELTRSAIASGIVYALDHGANVVNVRRVATSTQAPSTTPGITTCSLSRPLATMRPTQEVSGRRPQRALGRCDRPERPAGVILELWLMGRPRGARHRGSDHAAALRDSRLGRNGLLG
jgi:Subtilase family